MCFEPFFLVELHSKRVHALTICGHETGPPSAIASSDQGAGILFQISPGCFRPSDLDSPAVGFPPLQPPSTNVWNQHALSVSSITQRPTSHWALEQWEGQQTIKLKMASGRFIGGLCGSGAMSVTN